MVSLFATRNVHTLKLNSIITAVYFWGTFQHFPISISITLQHSHYGKLQTLSKYVASLDLSCVCVCVCVCVCMSMCVLRAEWQLPKLGVWGLWLVMWRCIKSRQCLTEVSSPAVLKVCTPSNEAPILAFGRCSNIIECKVKCCEGEKSAN